MDVIDYAVLEKMTRKLQADTKLNASTRKSIQSEAGINTITLHRRLQKLVESGYISKGIKIKLEHTYYVTEAGINALEEAKK